MGPKNLHVCVLSNKNYIYNLVKFGDTKFKKNFNENLCLYLCIAEFSFLHSLWTFIHFNKYLLIYYHSSW